jgi:hypothetical protein
LEQIFLIGETGPRRGWFSHRVSRHLVLIALFVCVLRWCRSDCSRYFSVQDEEGLIALSGTRATLVLFRRRSCTVVGSIIVEQEVVYCVSICIMHGYPEKKIM